MGGYKRQEVNFKENMLARIKERMGKGGSNKSISGTFGVNEVTF
jgi:hypothetical protein